MAAACQDPEVGRWIPHIPVPYTELDARAYVLASLQGWKDGTSHEFAIVAAGGGEYLGSIGFQTGADPRRFAVGYLVAPAARGRGVATRALRLGVRWIFPAFGVQRLALWTLPGNVASQRVAEKAGFRREGLVRNWQVGRDGRSLDVVMFAMTPDDLAEAEAIAAEDRAPNALEADDEAIGRLRVAPFPRELTAVGARTAPFVDVVAIADLAPGTMRRVTLADLDLLVAATPAGIVITEDRCPHMSAPLSIGDLDGCVVACPLHEGRFDLSSGETVQMPTTGGLDADGNYHSPWSPHGGEIKPEAPTKKLEARRLTRVHRLRYYPARIREGRLEAQIPFLPE